MKKYSIYALAFASSLTFTGCSDILDATEDGPSTVISTDIVETNYDPYSTDDYYVDYASWENRTKWNLAQVHDPTIVKADDGYYYMFQTDAGYGNPLTGHGHFYCRRSKDLISWDAVGPTYHVVAKATPETELYEGTYDEVNTWWVKNKLNEIRYNMDIALEKEGKDAIGPTSIDFSKVNKLSSDFLFWAPCVRKVPGTNKYRMYYVAGPSEDNKINGTNSWTERVFIGLMETTNIADPNSWVDKGYVVTNYSDRNLDFNYAIPDYTHCYFKYNAIDPSYIVLENGEHWLIYGSWHSGFAAVQIDPETGMRKDDVNGSALPWGTDNEKFFGKRIYTRNKSSRWQPSEAPEVIYRVDPNTGKGWYYVFMANDNVEYKYNTSVVRSENIDGDYYDINGNNFTKGGTGTCAYPLVTHPYKFGDDHGWVGISHCAVFDDGEGNWYYCSQQRYPNEFKGSTSSNAVMVGGIRAIVWTEDAWPLVSPERYAGIEQTVITENELIGTWQHIDQKYNSYKEADKNKVMNESVDVVLGSDHKVTSSNTLLNGKTWSLDAEKQQLKIGAYTLYLRRDLDWESLKTDDDGNVTQKRVPTIVYVGLSGQKTTTFWGKKKTVDQATE